MKKDNYLFDPFLSNLVKDIKLIAMDIDGVMME